MSAQFKLDQSSNSNPAKNELNDKKGNENIRPNIDHLLKRISLERKKEQRSSLILITFAILVVSVISVFFF